MDEHIIFRSIDIKMSWYLKMQWVLSNVGLSSAIFITMGAMVLFYSGQSHFSSLRVFRLHLSVPLPCEWWWGGGDFSTTPT